MKDEDDETVRSIRKTSCREASAPQPFARFRVLRIWPRATNDLCWCVCKPARRSGSASTFTGTFRDDTPSVPARRCAHSCDTFESLHHGAACRSAESEELPSEVDPIRASPRATRFGNLAAADRRFPIRDAGMVLTFYTGLADNAGGLVLIRAYRPQGGTTRAPGSMVAPPAPVGKRPIRTSKTHSSDLLSA